MKRKLGIIASCCMPAIGELDALSEIKAAGFDCFFTGLYKREDIAALRKRADEVGLEFETIHAPFANINAMWLPGMSYLDVYDKMAQSIDSAAEFGIPTVVTHLSSGWNAPEVNDLGLSRFDELVIRAERRGVTLAFENLRKIGNVAYIVDRYEHMKHVGFCYDWGHEHCYTATVDLMDICGDKTVCTHVHDNFGRDRRDFSCDPDIHLLPFDGNIDYQKVINKLDEYEYEGSIMLEVFNHRQYSEWSKEKFVHEAFLRAKKINDMSK